MGLTFHRLGFLMMVVALALPVPAMATPPWKLDAAEWARPRTVETVVAMPAVADAVHAWSQSVDSELVLHHPPGESGHVWVNELRSWLVAIGVPGDAVVRVPDHEVADAIHLSVRRATGGN